MTLFELMALTKQNEIIEIYNLNREHLMTVRQSKQFEKDCPHYEVKYIYPSAKLYNQKHRYCIVCILETKSKKIFASKREKQKTESLQELEINNVSLDEYLQCWSTN